MKTSDSGFLTFMARMVNVLSLGIGTSWIYSRYSQIVYEGDSLNIFGVLTYNGPSDQWEMTDPLAIIKEGIPLNDYTNELIKS